MPRWQCQLVSRSFAQTNLSELKSRLAEVLEILLQPKSQLTFFKSNRPFCGRPNNQKGRLK